MAYERYFKEKARKEWDALNRTVREQFKKVLARRLECPRVPSAAFFDMPDCYKIKLRNTAYRLVYRVDDGIIAVIVVAVGKRDKGSVYEEAQRRQ